MARSLDWIDRLRVGRVVWMLDQRLYDLPRRSRIAKRREIRDNLLAAAGDVGTSRAIDHLGDRRRLATQYLVAELGDGPRHSWVAAAYFAGAVPLLSNWLCTEATLAFAHGVSTASQNAAGSFAWNGVPYLQSRVTDVVVDGHGSSSGGAWTPLTWLLLLVGTVLVGRLWRALPPINRSRQPTISAG